MTGHRASDGAHADVEGDGSRPLALVGGVVIDGRGDAPVDDAVVVMEGDRITSVGPRGGVTVPPGARVVDVAGKYVLPGLIDVHVHYFEWMGELFLAHGVTTVKDVGNDVEWISTARDEIADGRARGPRIFYTGNGLDAPPPRRDHFIGIEDPEMARHVVPLLHEKGAIAVKVREHMEIEPLRAAVEAAHDLGMRITGHLRATDAREAALAGIDGLEHASGIVQATVDPWVHLDLENLEIYARYVAERKAYSLINDAKARELVDLLASRAIALIPTMSGWWRMASPRRDDFAREDSTYASNPSLAYVPDEARSIWTTSALYKIDDPDDLAQLRAGYRKIQELLRHHHGAGGKVLAGSDTYLSIPGLSLQRELLFLVDAGFTPIEAIAMATYENAKFMGQDHEIGSVGAGLLADMVVLDASPLDDIANIGRVSMVVKGGRVVDTSYHPDHAVPTPRPTMQRPLWVERELVARGGYSSLSAEPAG